MNLQQCTLLREHDGQRTLQVAWIPQQFAKAGKLVELKDANYLWTGPWQVVTVFKETALDEGYIREHQRIDFGSLEPR